MASRLHIHTRMGAARLLLGENGLTAFETKVAQMRAAGATQGAIALALESNQASVQQALIKPRVARLVLVLQGMIVGGTLDGIKDLNEAIEKSSTEAFGVTLKNMRELDELGMTLEEDPKSQIRAKLGAVATAQDILDRAGKRAPVRTFNVNANVPIPPEAVTALTDVLREMSGVGQGGEGHESTGKVIGINKTSTSDDRAD